MPRRLYGFFILVATITLLTIAAIVSALTSQAGPGSAAAADAPHAITTQAAVKAAAAPADAPQGVWTDIATFPAAVVSPTPGTNPLRIKRAAAAAYFPNGNVYLLGGRHGVDGEDVALRWIWQYAPGPNTWTQKTALLDGTQQGSIYTANMAAAVLTNANGVRIYAVGGNSVDSVPTPAVRVYDPVADTLSTDDPWPASPVRIPGGWGVYNNVLYVFGGFSDLANGGTGGVFTDTWKFDPSQPSGSRWSQVTSANLNLGRAYIASVVVDGYLYAVGGDTWTPGTPGTLNPVTNVERLDLRQANPTWQVIASLPTARGDMGAWGYNTGTGYEISGKVAVAGGHYPTPDNVGYLYDPGSNSWGAFPNMVHATRNYGYTQLNGILYALGGYDYSNSTPNGANFNQAYNATVQGTPTNTPIGGPPSATRTSTPGGPTNTPTRTPSPTATSCSTGNYAIATATGTIVPGTTNIGSACDDCDTAVTLPFSWQLYGQSFTTANASSNGKLEFVTVNEPGGYTNSCLPAAPNLGPYDYTIFPYWDDQRTDVGTGVGIFTSVSGTAPNRIFNIEWRTTYFSGGGTANYEVRLYEGQSRFDVVYGTVTQGTTSATSGVQGPNNLYTQYFCNGSGGAATGVVTYTLPTCNTPTVTPPASTPTRTATTAPSPTGTATTPIEPTSTATTGVVPSATGTAPPTVTAPPPGTATATATPPCGTSGGHYFTATLTGGQEVPPNGSPGTGVGTFYLDPAGTTITYTVTYTGLTGAATASHLHRGAPGQAGPVIVPFCAPNCPNPITGSAPWDPANTSSLLAGNVYVNIHTAQFPGGEIRGQLIEQCATPTPIVPTATRTPPPPTATATACSITFTDVSPSDYFYTPVTYLFCHGVISGYSDNTYRPYNNTTRSQMVKIVVLGFGMPIATPSGGNYTFTDVQPSHPFFQYIETAAAANVVSGYTCGGPGEPCDPQNRPYFRPYANVTRGQLSKIDVVAAGWTLLNPTTQSFEDVFPNTAFYEYVETAYCHGIISGYTCGGPGEPCDPQNRPYFRQNNDATRGQIAKIVYLSIVAPTGACTPAP